jgi:hypothetical protein
MFTKETKAGDRITNYHDITEILLKVALNTITRPFSCAREDANSTHYKTYEQTHR